VSTNANTEMAGRLRSLRILPVIVIDDAADAVPLARALSEGGLPCAEVTFRTAAAAEAIRRMSESDPSLLVGAGTVLTPEQAKAARDAGAKFIVSPGFGPAVVDWCLSHDIPVFPGVATPTEVEAALGKGLTVLKFFPAEPMGGVKFLKAIAAPYGMVEWMPTGGINRENVGGYLDFKKVVACGGSWMAPSDWIAGRQFARVREETELAVRSVRGLAAVGGA
jgi:2-dehydro-3-deoxyphosphogluconate aldolase / (4S)-4-hydroxy-2-oxoglutarate aldolase